MDLFGEGIVTQRCFVVNRIEEEGKNFKSVVHVRLFQYPENTERRMTLRRRRNDVMCLLDRA